MCGRFSLDRFPKLIVEALINAEAEFMPRSEIYPTNKVDVIFRSENENEMTSMTWGWERSFSKRSLINTRSFEAWKKKTWAQALKERRCVIPASGFFEWDENQPKGKRDKYRIDPMDEDGFAFGGLYEINSDGEMFMSILTTKPNKKMNKISHRMPVIVAKEQFNSWLTEDQKEIIDSIMQPVEDTSINIKKLENEN